MAEDENEQEHILGLESGEMMLLWQLHCPGMGQAVEITTGARPLGLQGQLQIPRFVIYAGKQTWKLRSSLYWGVVASDPSFGDMLSEHCSLVVCEEGRLDALAWNQGEGLLCLLCFQWREGAFAAS